MVGGAWLVKLTLCLLAASPAPRDGGAGASQVAGDADLVVWSQAIRADLDGGSPAASVKHPANGDGGAAGEPGVRQRENHQPSAGQAAAEAELIVWGQVERLERDGGSPVASLRVAHLAKGDAGSVVVFRANPLDTYVPSASLGGYGLYFLVPTGSPSPRWQLAAEGRGAMPGSNQGGQPFVGWGPYLGVTLPEGQCTRYVPPTCWASLLDVLGGLGLPVPRPVPSPKATYRVASVSCPPCGLELLAAEESRGVEECVSMTLGSWDPAAAACVRRAASKGRAFHLHLPDHGIDSRLVLVFSSMKSGLRRYSYDSSITGGGACAASVRRVSCDALRLAARSEGGLWASCQGQHDAEEVCNQWTSRLETLGPTLTVATLRCASRVKGDYQDCAQVGQPGGKRDVAPDPTGDELLCGQNSLGSLDCGSSW